MVDVSDNRVPRLRPMASDAIENTAHPESEVPDAELLERLEVALAALPADERAAAVVAFGLEEGPVGVAMELGISQADADALSRNALQLLRGAFADVDLDGPEVYARLHRRRRHLNQRPGDRLDRR